MNFKKLVVASALAVVFVVSASAETMRLNIPFKFHAGSAVMPAGNYLVKVDRGSHRIDFTKLEGHAGCYLPVRNERSAVAPGKSVLVFERYGDTHFLRTVQPSSAVGFDLFVSKAEREMASRAVDNKMDIASVQVPAE